MNGPIAGAPLREGRRGRSRGLVQRAMRSHSRTFYLPQWGFLLEGGDHGKKATPALWPALDRRLRWPVRQTTDHVVCDLVNHPFDVSPEGDGDAVRPAENTPSDTKTSASSRPSPHPKPPHQLPRTQSPKRPPTHRPVCCSNWAAKRPGMQLLARMTPFKPLPGFSPSQG